MRRSTKIILAVAVIFCRTEVFAKDEILVGRSPITTAKNFRRIISVDFTKENKYKSKDQYISFDLNEGGKYAVPNGYLTTPEMKHDGPSPIRRELDVGMWALSGEMVLIGNEFKVPRTDGVSNNDFPVWIAQVRDDTQRRRTEDIYNGIERKNYINYSNFNKDIATAYLGDGKSFMDLIGESKSGWKIVFVYTDPAKPNSFCGNVENTSSEYKCDDTTRMHGKFFKGGKMFDMTIPASEYKNFTKAVDTFDTKLKEWSTFN